MSSLSASTFEGSRSFAYLLLSILLAYPVLSRLPLVVGGRALCKAAPRARLWSCQSFLGGLHVCVHTPTVCACGERVPIGSLFIVLLFMAQGIVDSFECRVGLGGAHPHAHPAGLTVTHSTSARPRERRGSPGSARSRTPQAQFVQNPPHISPRMMKLNLSRAAVTSS